MQSRKERFAVHTYEVDAFRMLAVPALAGYLQEVAGIHAEEMGCGLEALMQRGLTWVLARQRLDILEPIVLGDVLEIATWPSGIDRLLVLRDFVLKRRDGRTVAKAITQWLVLDVQSRRPVRPEKALDGRAFERLEHVLPEPAAKLPQVRDAEAEERFRIRYQDIDVNLHVNNTSYVAWAIETVPRETWRSRRLGSLEAHYLAECSHGSTVVSRADSEGAGRFVHTIAREEDGRELARLRTAWVARTGA